MPADILYLQRRKALLDTSVYVSHLRCGSHREAIAELIRTYVLFLSSVVYAELAAGAASKREQAELVRLKRVFATADRVLTPTDRDWSEAGETVNRLWRVNHLPARTVVGLTHDVLIAMSARNRGIQVITENRRDFERIRSVRDFQLTVWPTGR